MTGIYWDYRVFRNENGFLTIHEVYYNKRGKRMCWTDPTTPGGDTLEELRADLEHMLKALDRKVIRAPARKVIEAQDE